MTTHQQADQRVNKKSYMLILLQLKNYKLKLAPS